jgi:hypothetical protein
MAFLSYFLGVKNQLKRLYYDSKASFPFSIYLTITVLVMVLFLPFLEVKQNDRDLQKNSRKRN